MTGPKREGLARPDVRARLQATSMRSGANLFGDLKPEYKLWHQSGPHVRAVFADAFTARMCERGLGAHPDGSYFYFTDMDDRRVTFAMNRYGHAYSILETLDRHEREGGDNAKS